MAAPIFSNPQVVASGIGALGSLGSSFLSGMFNRSSMESQAQYAKDLMKYEWDNFKSPQAQVRSLAAAGINPAVALGQGGPGYVSSPSPSMPSSTPPSFDFASIGDFVKAMAEAKKANMESVAKKLENDFNEATMEDRIKRVGLENSFTTEQIQKTISEWQKIKGEVNILSTDAEIKKIDLEKHRDLLDWQIKKFSDEHNLSQQQFEALKEQLPVILDKLKAEKDILDVDAEIAKGFKESMTQLGIVGDVIKIIGQVVKIFK